MVLRDACLYGRSSISEALRDSLACLARSMAELRPASGWPAKEAAGFNLTPEPTELASDVSHLLTVLTSVHLFNLAHALSRPLFKGLGAPEVRPPREARGAPPADEPCGDALDEAQGGVPAEDAQHGEAH